MRAPAAEAAACSICRETAPVQLHLLLSCGAQPQDVPAGPRDPVLHPRHPNGRSCAYFWAACCVPSGATALCFLFCFLAQVAAAACYLSGKSLPTMQLPACHMETAQVPKGSMTFHMLPALALYKKLEQSPSSAHVNCCPHAEGHASGCCVCQRRRHVMHCGVLHKLTVRLRHHADLLRRSPGRRQ